MKTLLQNYIDSFLIHVATKTTDKVLHEFLADVYEFKFKVLHTIAEKRQDLGLDEAEDCDVATKEMMTLLESEKSELERMVKESNSIWMDNLLRGLLDELEWLIGTAKWFVKQEMEEEEPEEEPEEETIPTTKSLFKLK